MNFLLKKDLGTGQWKISSEDEKTLEAYLDTLPKGSVLNVAYSVESSPTTRKQQNYFNLLVGIIAKETGTDHNSIKDIIKVRAGFVNPETGEVKSSNLGVTTAEEMENLIEEALKTAEFLCIRIPEKPTISLDPSQSPESHSVDQLQPAQEQV